MRFRSTGNRSACRYRRGTSLLPPHGAVRKSIVAVQDGPMRDRRPGVDPIAEEIPLQLANPRRSPGTMPPASLYRVAKVKSRAEAADLQRRRRTIRRLAVTAEERAEGPDLPGVEAVPTRQTVRNRATAVRDPALGKEADGRQGISLSPTLASRNCRPGAWLQTTFRLVHY